MKKVGNLQLRDIVINLFRGLAAVVTLNFQPVGYQRFQLLLQFDMLAQDSSMLEVDTRVSRQACKLKPGG